jgi:hypothetical protein
LLLRRYLAGARPQPHQSLELFMLILIGVTVFVAAFVVTVIASAGRRSGILDLGSVSTQWLAEHREYGDGGRSR